jgi:dTDP-glucose 4,6-dehydratase
MGLNGARIFVTGGTGFFGYSILSHLISLTRDCDLGISITVLSRRPGSFVVEYPEIACDPAITWLHGDIASFEFSDERFTHVIHAAVSYDNPASIVPNTRRMLDFAKHCGAGRFLFVSSGAVYDPVTEYAHGKLESERLCFAQDVHESVVARCYAFVGPHMRLNGCFAVGNFMRDALSGGPIVVNGDGTSVRSYMYGSDLAAWLTAILADGVSGHAYDVGSEEAVSMRELAGIIGEITGVDVVMQGVNDSRASRYVPDTSKTRSELGLSVNVGLREAIRKTYEWYGRRA